MVNRPLIRPYFLGGELWGGSLDSHDRGGLNKWCVARMSLAKEFIQKIVYVEWESRYT